MTASQWDTVGVIVGLLISFVTVYLLVRSNIREQVRQRNEELDRAVTDAKAPLIADNARLSGQVLQLQAQLDRRDQRITELEDRLYGREGPQR